MLKKDDAGEWRYIDPAQEEMVFELAMFTGRDLTEWDALLQEDAAWQGNEPVRAYLKHCRAELFEKFQRRYSDNEAIEDALNLYWERLTRARMHITGKALEIADRKVRENQKARSQKPRTTVETDDGGTKKIELVARALRMAGPEAGTPDVWPHLQGLLTSMGCSVVEHGAKSERWLEATDASNKVRKFTHKGVQNMLREIRGAASTKGRPKKKPA